MLARCANTTKWLPLNVQLATEHNNIVSNIQKMGKTPVYDKINFSRLPLYFPNVLYTFSYKSFSTALKAVPIMTSLRYTKATNTYIWADTKLTFTIDDVGWTKAPTLTADSCFWYLNDQLVPTPCDHPEGFHFICED